jgi:hypothetical protein
MDALGYGGPRIGTGAFTTGYQTLNIFGRVDVLPTESQRLELRGSTYSVESRNARGVGGLSDVSRGTSLKNRDATVAASLLSSFSPRLFNQMRGQFTVSQLDAPANDQIGPAVAVSGVASWGTSTSSPTARDLSVVQLSNTATLQQGAHLLKVGGDLLYNRTTITFPGSLQGSYTFASVAALQRGTYLQFQQAFGAPSLFQANPNLGMFVQDEWRARPGLTIQAGLRYDLQGLPDPIELDANNVSPRIGMAWAPNPQTVVRMSGGLYFDRIPLRATSNALQRDGVNYRTAVLSFGQAGAPTFPAVLDAFPEGVLSATTSIDRRIESGNSRQVSAQVERALGRSASVTVGYSSLRGRKIIMSRNINVPTLTAAEAAARGIANLGRPNPNFGNISQYQSIGDSWFNGLTVSLASRGALWGETRVSYTLSRAVDDAGNAFFSTPQDAGNVLADKGPSDNDQRQRLVVSGSIGAGRSAWLSRALGGIQFGYLVSVSTGLPVNPVTGTDRNNDTTINDRPVGMGRNSFRQRGSSTVDLRASRAFQVGGSHKVEALLEVFNALNRLNVVNVNNTFGTGVDPLPAFGRVTVAGDPRQVQFGIKWSF